MECGMEISTGNSGFEMKLWEISSTRGCLHDSYSYCIYTQTLACTKEYSTIALWNEKLVVKPPEFHGTATRQWIGFGLNWKYTSNLHWCGLWSYSQTTIWYVNYKTCGISSFWSDTVIYPNCYWHLFTPKFGWLRFPKSVLCFFLPGPSNKKKQRKYTVHIVCLPGNNIIVYLSRWDLWGFPVSGTCQTCRHAIWEMFLSGRPIHPIFAHSHSQGPWKTTTYNRQERTAIFWH